MASQRTIKVTKLDAAQRQLRTAIALWFADGDPVSIHSLAYSSHEIIHKLYRAKGLKHLMFDSLLVTEDNRKQFAIILKESANFFKHSNKSDENESHEFELARNDMFLLYSVIAMEQIGEEISDSESAFIHWHCFQNPHLLGQGARKKISDSIPAEQLAIIVRMKKSDFLSKFLSDLAIQRARGVNR